MKTNHLPAGRTAPAAIASFALAFPALGQQLDESNLWFGEATESRTIDEQRASEIRALVDDLLLETDLLSAKLTSDASVGSIDLHVSLGMFQEEDELELDSKSHLDHDQDGVVDDGDLARAAQNPVADLISLPFQNNLNLDTGTFNHAQNVLNIQPVIPFNLDEEWNLITRTIVPIVYQPSLFPGDDHDFGLGDIQFTPFLSPRKPVGGWILGGGPVFQFPTASDERLGARKWTIGPSAIALRMDGPWVYGAIVQNVWSVAGSGDNNVNAFLLQPFVNYNMADGWYLVSSPIITANWEASSGNKWVVPLGGGLGRVFRLGDQPVNVSFQGFYNVETPDLGAEWTLRFQFQFLFPR